jgi:hypothetical protein
MRRAREAARTADRAGVRLTSPGAETAAGGALLLYLGGLERRKDADGNATCEAGMIFASPALLTDNASPIFVKNAATSAARVVDASVSAGTPVPKEVKLAIFFSFGWKSARGFAVIDAEHLIGWECATSDPEGPVIIKAERGELAARMLDQIRAAAAQ